MRGSQVFAQPGPNQTPRHAEEITAPQLHQCLSIRRDGRRILPLLEAVQNEFDARRNAQLVKDVE